MSVNEKPIKLSSSTKISSVSPWSLALNAFFYSIALGIMVNGVVALAWQGLNRAGLFAKADSILITMAGDEAAIVESTLTFEKVMAISVFFTLALLASVPIFALISAGIFNAISRLTGGVRVTLTSKVFRSVSQTAAAQEAELAEVAKKDQTPSSPASESLLVSQPVKAARGKRARRDDDALPSIS